MGDSRGLGRSFRMAVVDELAQEVVEVLLGLLIVLSKRRD